MPILFKRENIFSQHVEALVNPVNCVGIMGKGLALQFKNRFPDNYRSYRTCCSNGGIQLGHVFTNRTPNAPKNPRYVINFPTKYHWRDKSNAADIIRTLSDLERAILINNIRSVAIPPLGCGLGGLNWREIKPHIIKSLSAVEEDYSRDNEPFLGVIVEPFSPTKP